MVCTIVWSGLALKTYISNIEYLKEEWTEAEVRNFITAVEKKIVLLSLQPRMGRITNKKRNVRRTMIHKRIALIYRYKPLKGEIELVRFWNNYQNPKK